MPTEHHHRAGAGGPSPRASRPQERHRSGTGGVTVADLVDRLRDEQAPHPAAVPRSPLGFQAVGDDQPTLRISHRGGGGRTHVGPWIAGALASATVLSTSLVGAHWARPGSATDGGGDPTVSDAGNHTRYTPGGLPAGPRELPAGPRIPAPREAGPDETVSNNAVPDGASSGSPSSPVPDPRRAERPSGETDAHRTADNTGSQPGGDPLGTILGDVRAGARRAGGGPDRVQARGCDTPGHILDLSNWKLTLPTGSGSSPTEIAGNALGSLTGQHWFTVHRGCAVAFRAPVNGVTTSGSKNPRSELREMTGGGADNAGWSSTSGTHTMVLREAFTTLPSGKPQVVGGQIHDADDDISVFRLEGSNLYITNGNDPHYKLVTSDYVLGTPFEAKFVVAGGVVRAYYNGRLVATINKDFSDAYFKAGAYTQANCQDASPCSSGNYGEVVVYSLRVTHS